MDRLSDWRAAAWIGFCLAALAGAAAVVVPAALRNDRSPAPTPRVQAAITPRTHLFGQVVTATLAVPSGLNVRTAFAPYRVLRRTQTQSGRITTYRFTLDCLRSACLGPPGTEREVALPPVQIDLPNGKKLIGLWPPLRQASRLAPADLRDPALRGDLVAVAEPVEGRHRVGGILYAVAAGAAFLAAAGAGLRWLGWRPRLGSGQNGARNLSSLEYALVVTGIAAGAGQEDRRTALESLAIALDERGLGELAAKARSIAWSPRPPGGESLRSLAAEAQSAARERS